jgi:hypothetical protein
MMEWLERGNLGAVSEIIAHFTGTAYPNQIDLV